MIFFVVVFSLWVGDLWAADSSPVPSSSPGPSSVTEATAPSVPSSTNLSIDKGRIKLKLRDPFRMSERALSNMADVKSELELFNLEELKLIGILSGAGFSKGMVLGPDKKTYIVTPQTKIGTNGGVIRKITANRLIIQEKKMNLAGEVDIFDKELRLTTESNSAPPILRRASNSLRESSAPMIAERTDSNGTLQQQEILKTGVNGMPVPPLVSETSNESPGSEKK